MIVKKRLGEMLIESNFITEEQLKAALLDSKKAKFKLGQYLVRQSIVTEQQIVDMLSQQLKIEKYHPVRFVVDEGIAKVLAFDVAQKYQVVPIHKRGRLLTIAMVDPLDINAMDTIEIATNSEIEPIVCTEKELNQLTSNIYSTQAGLESVVESMEVEITAEDKTAEEVAEEVQVASLQDGAGQAPVIKLVNQILIQAVKVGASDIHISPKQKTVSIRYRIDGKLHEMPSPQKTLFLPMVARLKILANMDITVSRIPQDGRLTLKLERKEINVRVSTIPTIFGENLVLRLLDMSSGVYTLEKLGMNKDDQKKILAAINKPYGMILSTGPTGSGKSTSMYAILGELINPEINIITVEDPVEYRIENIRQVQLNRKAGMTFASGLRSILRQDPDVIMVGEIRDHETAAVSVQAAQTGHRLLSTVHTNDAAGAITRFIDMGIEPFLMSTVLLLSFAQRLLRTVCSYCTEPYTPPQQAIEHWGLTERKDAQFMKGRGCSQCMNTGYKGRTGVFEVLTIDEMIQDMIFQKRSAQEITRAAVAAGKLRTLKDDAIEKVINGQTTLEEAITSVMT